MQMTHRSMNHTDHLNCGNKCIEQCISNVKTWMFHNKLKMNDDETEAIPFARKGLVAEHLPKLITINDTTITLRL